MLLYLSQFDNKQWGSPSSFLSYKRLAVLDILVYIITKSKSALIDRSAMVYCASKPMEKSHVLQIII